MAVPRDTPSPYQLLAEQGDISVYRCDQGCLHLQVGNVNLRLEDDEFQDLITVIGEAAARAGAAVPLPARYGRVQ
jgi:hypothetical protein